MNIPTTDAVHRLNVGGWSLMLLCLRYSQASLEKGPLEESLINSELEGL